MNASPNWLAAAQAVHRAPEPIDDHDPTYDPFYIPEDVVDFDFDEESAAPALALVPEPDEVVDGEAVWEPNDYATLGAFDGGAAKLADSAVAPLVAAARGYATVPGEDLDDAAKRWRLGRGAQRERLEVSATEGEFMEMPWHSAMTDQPVTWQIRPDASVEGGGSKYEFVGGNRSIIGLHPAYDPAWVADASTVLIAEGLLKGDSALSAWLVDRGATPADLAWAGDGDPREALADLLQRVAPNPEDRAVVFTLGGSGNWHNNPEWNVIDLKKKRVLLGFDGDVVSNPNVFREAERLHRFVKRKKAKSVDLLFVPLTEDDEKAGIDDFFAAGSTWRDLIATKGGLPRKPEKAKDVVVVQPTAVGIYGDVPDPSLCEYTQSLPLTRMGLAERIHAHYGDRIAYRESTDQVMVFADGVWQDGTIVIGRLARTVIRSITVHEADWAESSSPAVQQVKAQVDALEAAGATVPLDIADRLVKAQDEAREALEKFGRQAESNAWAREVIGDLIGFNVVPEERWDGERTTFRLNFRNGTVNLEDRDEHGIPVLHPHDPTDHITMQWAVDFDPTAQSDDLDKVRDHFDIAGPGTAEAIFRYLGLATTAAMEAKTYLNLWSAKPDAAKSTIVDALTAAMGGVLPTSYAGVLTPGDVAVTQAEASKPLPNLDRMRGKRLWLVGESEKTHIGGYIVKSVTGGDMIPTRTLNSPGGTWQPAGKMLFTGQGPTPFSTSDLAMVGRFFGIDVPSLPPEKIDRNLRHRLRSREGQTAVAFAVVMAACRWLDDYRSTDDARGALAIPAHAEAAKTEAIGEMNPLTDWVEEFLIVGDEDALDAEYGNTGRCNTALLAALWNGTYGRAGRRYTPRQFGPILSAAVPDSGISTATEFKHAFNFEPAVRVAGKMRTGIRVADEALWARLIRGRI